MSFCTCWSCNVDATNTGVRPDWLICASVATAGASAPAPGGDLPFGANTSIVTTIGTTGNFVNQDINGLLSGRAWFTTNVTFSFPALASDYPSDYSDPAPQNGFVEVTEGIKSAARYAFGLISKYSQLSFTEVAETTNTSGMIRIGGSATPETSYAYLPGSFPSAVGDIWFGNIRFDQALKGSYAFSTVLHEIGHAVGMKHGHETTPSNPDTTAYGVLPAFHDSTEWSLMTYRSYIGASGNFYENAVGSGNQTYMIDDIATLQYIYGPNFNTSAGDTVYTWSATTGEMFIDGVGQGASSTNTAYGAIWDGNGTDTYDLSNYGTNLSLDLRPGEWSLFDSVQLANLGTGQVAHGNLANSHLYMNSDTRSLIESAIGGTGNDTLRGNSGANSLSGGGGNDSLEGDAGNDVLNGGNGTDTALFSSGSHTYAVTFLGGTTYQFVGPDGTDTLTDVEFVRFAGGPQVAVAAACFVPGTLIGVPGGCRAVETLRIGDLVLTAGGDAKPIRWIGRRRYFEATLAANPHLQPVRVVAGALGEGRPWRDLRLSPQHAVFVAGATGGGVLVPVAMLENGRSIVQEPVGAVTYLHLELDEHEVVLAEGLPVESFGDEASRALFENAAEYRLLYPDAPPKQARLPRCAAGARIEEIRRLLFAPVALAARRRGRLVGCVERIAGGVVEGWAMDEAAPERPVELELATPLGCRRVIANRYRGDLRRAGIGSGRYGFRVPVGSAAQPVVVRRAGDGALLRGAG